MKKSLIKVVIALVVFTVLLAIAQNEVTPYLSDSEWDTTWESWDWRWNKFEMIYIEWKWRKRYNFSFMMKENCR